MNTMLHEVAQKMPQMMGEGMKGAMGTMGPMGQMLGHPVAQGAAMAGAGYRARGIVARSLFANPLTLLVAGMAGGVAAGYLLHKYRKEIVLAASQASGMSRDFALQQKENLADLMEEAKEQEAQAAPTVAEPAAPAA